MSYYYSVPPPRYSSYYTDASTKSGEYSYPYYSYTPSQPPSGHSRRRTHTRYASYRYADPVGSDPLYAGSPTYSPRYSSPKVHPSESNSFDDCASTTKTMTVSKSVSKTANAVKEPETPCFTPKGAARLLKAKQGLVGFVNGSSKAAMADTGSRKNVMSQYYAQQLDLTIKGSPSTFEIGNTRKIQSLGTVSVLWDFAENPKETFLIVCHVLPHCTYDLILGNGFLSATKTLTEFCHRISRCLFSVVNNVSHFGFLGETSQRLRGALADKYPVLAIPDTGADRNIMSLQYAVSNGFELKTGQNRCGYLQFADGSYDKTVGQVETYWTFASGERIPATFEVLEYCCSDVVIGDSILVEQNIFVEHAASICLTEVLDDNYELAPFDFVSPWQRSFKRVIKKAIPTRAKGDVPESDDSAALRRHIEEQDRRSTWDFEYKFGAKASAVEKELEKARRERFESLHIFGRLRPKDDQTDASRNEPTSQSRR